LLRGEFCTLCACDTSCLEALFARVLITRIPHVHPSLPSFIFLHATVKLTVDYAVDYNGKPFVSTSTARGVANRTPEVSVNKRVERNFFSLFVKFLFWAKSEIKFHVVNLHKEMDAFIFLQAHTNYYRVSATLMFISCDKGTKK
jgi:hypothetical protein